MNKYFVLFLGLVVAGCVTVDNEVSSSRQDAMAQPQQEMLLKFLSLRQVQKGMTRAEVKSVLGDRLLIGYEYVKEEAGPRYKPLTVANPYRQENFSLGSKSYQVDYYFLGIKEQDGVVTDDELAPLIFLNDKLQGQGWDFLNKLKK